MSQCNLQEQTKSGLLKASVVTGALIVGMAQAHAQSYSFIQLDSLGGTYDTVFGVNNAGQVVGMSTTADSTQAAVVWNGSTPSILASPAGLSSSALAINDAGQSAGVAFDNTLGSSTYGTQVAVVWNGATPTTLASLGGTSNAAAAINGSGQVAGYSSTSDNAAQEAVVWNGGTPTILSSLGGVSNAATGINNAGQVAGYSTTDGNATQEAVVWNGTTPTILSSLGGTSGVAAAINNAGQVVGFSSTSGNATVEAVLWNGTTATVLDSLGGGYSAANAINNAGQIVGSSSAGGFGASSAVLWNGTSVTDLNTFLTPEAVTAGWQLYAATGINDAGMIVGFDVNLSTGQAGAFALVPVPEPQVYAWMLAGFAALGLTARRRTALGR